MAVILVEVDIFGSGDRSPIGDRARALFHEPVADPASEKIIRTEARARRRLESALDLARSDVDVVGVHDPLDGIADLFAAMIAEGSHLVGAAGEPHTPEHAGHHQALLPAHRPDRLAVDGEL